MSSEFPRLQKKLDELRWEFEKKLQEVIKNNEELEDVELRISEANFIPRSPITKSAYYLREILAECLDKSGKISQIDKIDGESKIDKIDEEHISAAEGLLKLGRYQETAIDVLSQVLGLKLDEATKKNLNSKEQLVKEEAEDRKKHLKNLKKLASEALSECGSEIAMFNAISKNKGVSFYDGFACEQQECVYYEGETPIRTGKRCSIVSDCDKPYL